MSDGLFHGLRVQRGWTQEELAERSGVSVRTVRNLELGLIRQPRRSTVDLLLSVLDPELHRRLRERPSLAAEQILGDPAPRPVRWLGPRAPITSFVGRERDLERLRPVVLRRPVTLLTGPGGAGKSRLAQALGQSLGPGFAQGVAVVELGQLPPERPGREASAVAAVLNRIERALGAEPDRLGGGDHDAWQDPRLLVVLDDTEHLPFATAQAVDQLLRTRGGVRVVVTSRRVSAVPSASIHEVAPLPAEQSAALLLDRVRHSCPALDLDGEPALVDELCRRLDGLPRLIEFAANRLRTLPLSTLTTLSGGPDALDLLHSNELPRLAHQRSLRSDLQWSWELLDRDQQALLRQLAQLPGIAETGADLDGLVHGLGGLPELGLLTTLVESSLLMVARGDRYTYRMPFQLHGFLRARDLRPVDPVLRLLPRAADAVAGAGAGAPRTSRFAAV